MKTFSIPLQISIHNNWHKFIDIGGLKKIFFNSDQLFSFLDCIAYLISHFKVGTKYPSFFICSVLWSPKRYNSYPRTIKVTPWTTNGPQTLNNLATKSSNTLLVVQEWNKCSDIPVRAVFSSDLRISQSIVLPRYKILRDRPKSFDWDNWTLSRTESWFDLRSLSDIWPEIEKKIG